MERANFHMLAKRLHIDVADRSKRQATVRPKAMNQSFTFNSLVQLLSDRDKSLRCTRFPFPLRIDTQSLHDELPIRIDASASTGV